MLGEIMRGDASEAQIAGFLIALRTKGETVDELAGLAGTMRALATPVAADRGDLVDTAGTGGGKPTFNVSTTAALIAAGAGCALAKHGNRSATGLSGSADVLEALGARIDLEPDAVARCIDRAGFGFMFAPAHHAATRYVVPVRKELAVRTIFNFLGPLTNPAGARRQLIGVSDPAYLERMAGALARLGCDRALLVSSEDGLDEMSTSAPTHVVEVNGDAIRRYVVAPADVGIELAPFDAVRGGTPDAQRRTTRAILAGEDGPPRDIAALQRRRRDLRGRHAPTRSPSGVEAARAAIDSGAAERTLDDYVALSRELAPGDCAPLLDRRGDLRRSPRDERPRPHRRRDPRGGGPPPRGGPAGRARGPARRAARRPPVPRGADAPRRVAHRRAQAPLAERGRDPLRARPSRDVVTRLRARRRRRPVDPHRGPALRRLARRPARGARARPSCRSCARTSSSTPTRSTSPRSPAPTRSC